MFALLPLLAAIQQPPAPAPVCAWISTIRLLPGDTVEKTQGEDFDVFYVNGPAGNFGVYAGRYAQVSDLPSERAFAVGRLAVRRVGQAATFRGYLVTNSSGIQNHFFGSVFKGDLSDRAFFDRVTFGACDSGGQGG